MQIVRRIDPNASEVFAWFRDPAGNVLGIYQQAGLAEVEAGTPASMHSAFHNPNTPPPATPLVSGPVIWLPGRHGKVRRDGYRGGVDTAG